MSLFNYKRRLSLRKFQFLRNYASTSNEKNVAKEIYPPILDVSVRGKHERETLEMHKKIQALHTVEEKLIALNVPRYYGWESIVLNEGKVPYNFLPLVKSTTKTQLHQVQNECVSAPLTEEKLKQILEGIKNQLEKILVYHSRSQRLSCELEKREKPVTVAEANKKKSENLVEQIHRVIISNLSREFPHLLSAQVDNRPRIEAFWNVGGFGLTEEEREKRKKKKVSDDLLEDPSNKWIQYFGNPIIQLRSNLPLSPLRNITPSETWAYEDFPYDPVLTYALETKRLHGASVPGFWPDDEHKFGLLSLHSRPLSENSDDIEETIHSSAILSSFAWLLGQASYQGFTTFNDLTYPLVTQTIVSDGRLLSLYSYQMNTCVTFNDSGKRNECYTSGTLELYSGVEGDQIKGWNEAALTQLISMYLNTPQEREGVNMTPYLNPEESLVQHIKLEKKREWLHNTYRHLTSHRRRHLQVPEIFDWEYIYKVAFETRPMDARKRFFERGEDPLEERRLVQMGAKYIPKALRPENELKRKYEERFFPDV